MGRPRNGEPRPDTTLVAFRLSRALLQTIDEHAKRMSVTRTDAARDLIQRGLGTLGASSTSTSPESTTKRTAATRRKPLAVAQSSGARLDCTWCGARKGQPHRDRCPATGSLNGIFAVAAKAAARRGRSKP